MRVTRLRLKEIGPFDEIDLSFSRGSDPRRADSVLFVGPNGAGKSTLLYAIAGCVTDSRELLDRMRSMSARADSWFSVGSRDVHATAMPIGAVRSPDDNRQFLHRDGLYSLAVEEPLLWRNWRSRTSSGDIGAFVHGAPLVYSYGGTRSLVNNGHESAADNEFDAVTFGKSHSSGNLRAWVSDVMARRDSAIVQERIPEAEAISGGLRRLENFLSRATDTPQEFTRRIEDGEILLRSSHAAEGVPLHLLPEGLKSMLSWIGDLLRRLYSLRTGGVPHHELPVVLLLDEIEVHLHPKWQRLVLPAVERLLPNAQIFMSTHSPFVLASASDAQIVWLTERGEVITDHPEHSLRGLPYTAVLELMGIDSRHDAETTDALRSLDEVAERVRRRTASMAEFDAIAATLPQSTDVEAIIDFQRRQLERVIRTAAG